MEGLQLFAQQQVFLFMLVFARTGTAVLLMPGFGERIIPPQIRLVLALAISFVVLPLAPVTHLALPANLGLLFSAIGGEFLIGAFIGAATRVIFSALHMGGQLIGQSMGLSALVPEAAAGFGGSTATTNLLVMCGMTMIFVADLHILMIEAMVSSYRLFRPAEIPDMAGLSEDFIHVMSRAFLLAVKFASPFLIVAFLFNLGLGLTNRLMQSLPVFFVGMPFLLATGFLVLFATTAAIMLSFADSMSAWLNSFAT
jgi:flagellar biosynthetic protein FliR